MKKVFSDVVEYRSEDGGQALIADIQEEGADLTSPGMFVRLQSWDEKYVHENAEKFRGKRVRVTVEIIEDNP